MQEIITEKNQRIRIGRDIVITFLKICAGRVRVRLDAPKGVSAVREVQITNDKRQRPWRNHSPRFAARRAAGQMH